MGTFRPPAPQWTWEDVEAVLAELSPRTTHDPVRAHLMRALMADAARSDPRTVLREVIEAARLMTELEAQRCVSAIDRRPAAGASVC